MGDRKPISTLRALKHYPEESTGAEVTVEPRDDVLIHFAGQRSSVTPAEPIQGDCLSGPIAYSTDPMVLAVLRGGAVIRDGSFVFSERNELLRESVDRLASIESLARSHPDLESELLATPPEPSPEMVAVLGCQRAPNYFHWWIDVVARCWTIRNSPYRNCRLVTPPLTRSFQRESLQQLGQRFVQLNRPLQRFRNVVFARGLTYGSSQAIAPQAFEFAQWCRTAMDFEPPAKRRRLFLSRRGARSRGLVNEDEVMAALGCEFEAVAAETMSVRDQASLFAEAGIVVAPHGAGLTNLLFCIPPTPVVELVHNDSPPYTYRRLAAVLGHPYVAVGCKPKPDTDLKAGRRSLTASPTEVVAAVERLEKASDHLR